MNKILIKAIRPHRQKVLTQQGEEMKLQRWANKLAAEQLRGAGGDASGEQHRLARDALMREAVMNPEKHGLKFMAERVPFEGQELTSDLTEADPEGEAAAIDSQFAPDEEEEFFEANNTVKDNSDYHSKLFDEQGNLRTTLKPDEEEEAENTKTERQHVPMDADHPDYFKSSRRVAFSDAWSLLKNYTAEQTKEAMSQHMNDGLTPEELRMIRYKHVRDQNLSCRGCGKQLDRNDFEYGACLNCHTSTAKASQ